MFTGPSVSLILSVFASVEGSTLTIVGGVISVRDPEPTPMSIAGIIKLPRDQMDWVHRLELFLVDEAGEHVELTFPDGSQLPALLTEMGPFRGIRDDDRVQTPFESAFVINVPPFIVPPARSFAWQAQLDGETRPEWSASFRTTPPEPPPAP